MTPSEFKHIWIHNNFSPWIDFPSEVVESSPFLSSTKAFLGVGLPESGIPYTNFGIEDYDGKFCSVKSYYEAYATAEGTEFYWMIGADGAGNPICIDTAHNDRIVYLDHNNGFALESVMAKHLSELAGFMIAYKSFIKMVNEKYGNSGFFQSKFSHEDINKLEQEFKTLNANYELKASYWRFEIENLRDEIS